MDGYFERTSATTPATRAVESLVPLVSSASGWPSMVRCSGLIEGTSTPGAATATYGWRWVHGGELPFSSTAPTASTPGQLAGSSAGFPTSPWLPAATTTTTSCRTAYAIAS